MKPNSVCIWLGGFCRDPVSCKVNVSSLNDWRLLDACQEFHDLLPVSHSFPPGGMTWAQTERWKETQSRAIDGWEARGGRGSISYRTYPCVRSAWGEFCACVPGKEALAFRLSLASATQSTHKWNTPRSFRVMTNMCLISTESHNIIHRKSPPSCRMKTTLQHKVLPAKDNEGCGGNIGLWVRTVCL